MSKRSALNLDTIEEQAGETHNPVEVLKHRRKGTSKSRDGKTQIQGFFLPPYRTTLKMLAAREGKTLEAMMQEAMDDLFKKHKIEMTS